MEPFVVFPILLIVVSAGIMIACAHWAKVDEDDVLRKVVTSLVQLMCLGTMVLGVLWCVNRTVSGPLPHDDVRIEANEQRQPPPSRPAVGSTYSATTPAMLRPPQAAAYSQQTREAERLRRDEEERELAAQQASQQPQTQPPQDSPTPEPPAANESASDSNAPQEPTVNLPPIGTDSGNTP